MMVFRGQRLRGVTLVGVAALLAAGCAVEATLAFALPLAMVALPLLLGRYPGEARLARLAEARPEPRPRPRSDPVPRSWLRDRRAPVRGGRLIAAALAVRPPPRPAVR